MRFLPFLNGHRKAVLRQDIKGRIVKSREAVLEVFSENMEGVKPCPILLGEKCIGQMCTFFMQFHSEDKVTKQNKPFWRCTFVETPLLLIELNRNIRSLHETMMKYLLKHESEKPHEASR